MAPSSLKGRPRRASIVIGACALFLVGALAYQAARNVVMQASLLDQLQSLRITPSENLTVNAGETLTLSAEGNFGTSTMPINALWSILDGNELGKLQGCDNTKRCTFLAGEESGTVTIQAEVKTGQADKVRITIEASLQNPFKDELPDWALEAIVRLHRLGIITGYENGKYGPADPVTNGQIVTLISRILRYTNSVEEPSGCTQSFEDVPSDHYAFIPICLFRQHRWIADAPTFRPDAPATRGRTAAFLTRAVGENLLEARGVTVEDRQYFDDVPRDHPFYTDTATTNITGLMMGYPNGDFGVENTLNRAEAAVTIYRTFQKVSGSHGECRLAGPDGSLHGG
jgi:hypothetical protein